MLNGFLLCISAGLQVSTIHLHPLPLAEIHQHYLLAESHLLHHHLRWRMLDGLDLHLHRRPHDIHNLYRQHHHQITQRGAEGLLPLLHQIKFQLVQWLLVSTFIMCRVEK